MTTHHITDDTERELAAVIATWGAHLECPQVKAGRIVGLQRFMFTWAILADITPWSYEERWCFHSEQVARAALDAWDGAEGTDPHGWHKHIPSCRRRENGDPATETVEP